MPEAAPPRAQGRTGATLTVMWWTFIGKAAGMVRDILIAAYFGAGYVGDAYAAAQAVPQSINSILNQGLSTVTVPYFHEDQDDAPRLNTALTYLTVATHVVLVAALILVGPYYLPLLTSSAQSTHEAERIVWLFALMLIPLDLAALWTGRLNAARRFVPLSAANLVRSLANVLVLLLLHRLGVISTGMSFLLGATAALLYMLPSTRPFRAPVKRTWQRTWSAVRLMPSQITSSVVGQVNFLVDQMFAASVASGQIFELTNAGRFLELPVSLFGSSLSTVLFPDFAEHARSEDPVGLLKALDRALYLTWVATLPIALLLIGFALPVTNVIYGHGRYDHAAVLGTAAVVAAYAGSLVFRTMQQFVAIAFFSYKNTRTLARVSVAFVVINALFDYILKMPLGTAGIALGTTIDGALYFGTTAYMLERMLVGRHAISVRPYLWALVAAAPLAPLGRVLSGLTFVHGWPEQFVLVALGSLVLLGLFLALLALIGGPKAKDAFALLRRALSAPRRLLARR